MLTDSYTPPDDACLTCRGAYWVLSELEQALEAHIRLEQNTLFPCALAYVASLETHHDSHRRSTVARITGDAH